MEHAERWTALGLDEVDPVDWRRTGITWRPIRRLLGAEIVGMAVFTAERPGEVVVEPHTEVDDGRGHQEVYVVLRGAALFLIDGTQVAAPAGTFLRVEPQAHREATARKPDTAVLALGGESTFEPGASEWIERARGYIRSDPPRAREIVEDLRRQLPGDRAIDVGEALLAVGRNDESHARTILAALINDAPQLREVLDSDPDLRDLLPY
jgi:hypothetical protein